MTLVKGFCSMALAATVATFATGVMAQQSADAGKREFEGNCLVCHALEGKGGYYVEWLKTAPPDLSRLAANNGGVFPFARTYEVIDGRAAVAGHGPADMPVWGRDYQVKAAEYYIDVPYDPEVYVRGRILALIDYLNRVQAK